MTVAVNTTELTDDRGLRDKAFEEQGKEAVVKHMDRQVRVIARSGRGLELSRISVYGDHLRKRSSDLRLYPDLLGVVPKVMLHVFEEFVLLLG
ncbi:hypothetical protein Tco_0575610 [Tanacetum coccineum]